MMKTPLAILLAALAAATPAFAEDKASLDPTNIIGNKELPKVLYIVPWKKPMPDDLQSRAMGSVLDEALSPIDRDVFRRQVRYDALVQPQAQAPDQAPAPKSK
jgi:hypothetical protein